MNKSQKLVLIIRKHKIVRNILYSFFSPDGYFNKIGWTNSVDNNLPLNNKNQPIPLATYPYLDFICERLNNQMTIFEYGSGNSTLFFASIVKEVYSVEHNKSWYYYLKYKLPQNCHLQFIALEYDGKYSIAPQLTNKKFDIVIVDGRDRVNCMKQSIQSLNDGGVIILDDSERDYYAPGIKFLLDNGFKKIDFYGIRPTHLLKACTTIFYRNNNVLDI